ncbi:MAG: hypothetical protein JWO41_467 [Candidatus Saccharibacteria bacterium]|nr:hypothetical protein [Candidatus Saccharibacteria bacterium]
MVAKNSIENGRSIALAGAQITRWAGARSLEMMGRGAGLGFRIAHVGLGHAVERTKQGVKDAGEQAAALRRHNSDLVTDRAWEEYLGHVETANASLASTGMSEVTATYLKANRGVATLKYADFCIASGQPVDVGLRTTMMTHLVEGGVSDEDYKRVEQQLLVISPVGDVIQSELGLQEFIESRGQEQAYGSAAVNDISQRTPTQRLVT